MLTIDVLKGNETLAGLTDEQLQTIATMSKTDEDAVIGNRFGEVYRQMDATIAKATGIERDGAEKTYVYLERATKAFADSLNAKYADYDEIKGKVDTLTKEVEEARKGGDAALKAQVSSLESELKGVRTNYDTLKAEKDALVESHKNEMMTYRVNAEIAKAQEGVTFKKGLNDQALKALCSQAVSTLMKNNPSFEDRDGVETLIFHDAEGAPMLNRENSSKPYTAKELLIKEFESLGILETKPTGGAGGKGNLPLGTITCKTRVEANDAIEKELLAKGYVRGSKEWNENFAKMWKDNEVDKLPMQ